MATFHRASQRVLWAQRRKKTSRHRCGFWAKHLPKAAFAKCLVTAPTLSIPC